MWLQSSVAEKRGPHKDSPLVEALHVYSYVHSHRHRSIHVHAHTHKYNDAWVRVRIDNLTKKLVPVKHVHSNTSTELGIKSKPKLEVTTHTTLINV